MLLAPSMQAGLSPSGPSAGRARTPCTGWRWLLSALSSHLAGLLFPALCVPAEAHIGAGQVFAAAVCFMVRVGFGGLGTIARPVATLLLVGKVQGSVQGASQEGVSFMGLRRTRSTGLNQRADGRRGRGRQGGYTPSRPRVGPPPEPLRSTSSRCPSPSPS